MAQCPGNNIGHTSKCGKHWKCSSNYGDRRNICRQANAYTPVSCTKETKLKQYIPKISCVLFMLHQFCFILISGSQVGFALFSSIEITVQRPICQNRFSGQVSNTSAGTILVQTGRIAHCTAVHNLAGRGNNNGELCKECTVAINSICVILTCDLASVSTHTNWSWWPTMFESTPWFHCHKRHLHTIHPYLTSWILFSNQAGLYHNWPQGEGDLKVSSKSRLKS